MEAHQRDIFGNRLIKEVNAANITNGSSDKELESSRVTFENDDDDWGSMTRTSSTPGCARLDNPESASWDPPVLRNDGGGGGGRGHRRWGGNSRSKGVGGKFDYGSGSDKGGRGRGGHRRGRSGNSSRDDRNRPSQPLNFTRLCDYISLTSDGVIMTLGQEVTEWEKVMNSDEMKVNKNSLMIAIQLLATKVCCESILTSQQLAVLSKTNASGFVEGILLKCHSTREAIKADLSDGSQQLCLFSRSGFINLDRSNSTFYSNLLCFCNYVVQRLSEKVMVGYLLPAVVSALETVILIKTKDETFADLVESFEKLKLELEAVIKQQKERPLRQPDQGIRKQDLEIIPGDKDAPDDYRDMTIVPTMHELLSEEEVFLRANKTSGAYNDAHHYLDVQFRLLRQDFVQPLKSGIQDFLKYSDEYLTHKKRLPIGSIRLYPGVLIKNMALERGALVYKLQLREGSYENINWATSKRLLTGSLVVLSSDLFKTAYFAVVADREVPEMVEGILSVSWEGHRPSVKQKCEYLMIECEVYFEAFRHTLQILQVLKLDDYPMCKFIVEASSDVDSPRYLKDIDGIRTLRLKSDEYETFNTLEGSAWPTNDALGLDPNQYIAFQAGLTKEFAIIQGPPGTGKTYLGLRIAEAFLNHRPTREKNTIGPILVVCYTNHALDQFLEGILALDEHTSVIRVGGRCKSEKLEKYTLANIFKLNSSGMMSKDYWSARRVLHASIDDLQEECSSILATFGCLKDLRGIVDFQCLSIWNSLVSEYPKAVWNCLADKNWFGLTDEMFERADFTDEMEKIVTTWFEVVQDNNKEDALKKPQVAKRKVRGGVENNMMEEESLEDLLESRIEDDMVQEFERLNLARKVTLSYIDRLSIDDNEQFLNSSEFRLREIRKENVQPEKKHQNLLEAQTRIRVAKNQIMFLERIFDLHKSQKIELPRVKKLLERCEALSSEDLAGKELGKIGMAQRWALYFNVVDRAQAICSAKIPEIEIQLIHEQKKLQECYHYAKGLLLKNAQVVGMTTTGAAKYRELVKMMQSKIVIVEEAAEVLESHIVTCITKYCEHLILIGDHRQLRPSTVVYELAKKFNLDVSLFERMINNNLNCYPLKVQHRMRPEIANLVVGTIYKELENHPSVSEYPTVPGVTKNLYFISHDNFEDSEMDSMSKSNYFEAKFLASLCRYLIRQGYTNDQITVLTTYTGQMFLLKKTVHAFSECEDVRVTSVDSFQGEENDIILLSLVRSNQESSIGFMSIDNRICVSLSRARHGLYIIGNMPMLASKSETWYQIQEKLKARDEIGPTLTLKCQTHGTESEVGTDHDFLKEVPSGGCRLRCNTVLQCEHKCEEFCHVTDRDHEDLFKCRKPCKKVCENDHTCSGLCSESPCPPCFGLINKKLRCSHARLMRCYQNIDDVDCTSEVKKKLLCGHVETVACHMNPREVRCRFVYEKQLLCGHWRDLQCSEDVVLVSCKEMVRKKLQPCGHEQEVECKFGRSEIKCLTLVDKIFECGHKINVRCGDIKNGLQCKESCGKELECGHGHYCRQDCHSAGDFDPSNCICIKNCCP